MNPITHQVSHFPSRLDDVEQPLVISIPDGVRSPIPAVILLHDTLPAATRECFVDIALAEAARWQSHLAEAQEPIALLQPFGRGNGGWLGPGGTDLFEALEHSHRQFPIDGQRILLAGLGAGATGALQLACWFPNHWSALALAGAVAEQNDDPPHPWEQIARQTQNIVPLLKNLADMKVRVEHPWWFDGLMGTPYRDHFDRLVALLTRASISFEVAESNPGLVPRTEWPSDIPSLLDWFLPTSPAERKSTRSHRTYSPRSWIEPAQIRRPTRDPKPSLVKVQIKPSKIRVQTERVAEMEVRCPNKGAVELDGQTFRAAAEASSSSSDPLLFQMVGQQWEQLPKGGAPNGEFVHPRTPTLVGPVWDMRWEGVVFVPGTLGEDRETRTLRRLATEIRDAWISGGDSVGAHPRDRSLSIDYPIVDDLEFQADQWPKHHVVFLGSPRTHLGIARLQGMLGCEWPDEGADDAVTPFRVAGKIYRNPRDGLFLLGPFPSTPVDRYLLLITATTTEGIAWAASFRTASLPDYLVFCGPKATVWGSCGADGRPIG